MAFTFHQLGGNPGIYRPCLVLRGLPGCWHHEWYQLALVLVRWLPQRQQRMFQNLLKDTVTFSPENLLRFQGGDSWGKVENQMF